jgi:hypothetical protein
MHVPSELSAERRTDQLSWYEADAGWLDPATGDVLMQVMTELASMMSFLGRAAAGRRITEIQALARDLLHQVARRIMVREINPWNRLRLCPEEPALAASSSTARIGVFPLSANPIHWGHLLSALSVMAHARLDKIVFVIASDSSPAAELFPEELRRGAAAEAISLFQPLFTLVPASAGKTTGGPASLFRLLGLNNQQMLEAFYISAWETASAGSVMETMDALWNQAGGASAGRNERLHSISLVMMDSAAGARRPRVLVVPQALPWISTAAVRTALCSSQHRDELAGLPACAFRHLRMLSAFD